MVTWAPPNTEIPHRVYHEEQFIGGVTASSCLFGEVH